MFKRQNTEYKYIYVENYIAVEIYKNQTKIHSVLAKIYKVLYVLLDVMLLETVSFLY